MCSVLHSELQGFERDATMERFRQGHNKVCAVCAAVGTRRFR